jgi:glucose dehydrogenase
VRRRRELRVRSAPAPLACRQQSCHGGSPNPARSISRHRSRPRRRENSAATFHRSTERDGMSRQANLSPQGLPCLPPPWGELVALDLSKGTIRWHVPLGTAVKLEGKTIAVLGTPTFAVLLSPLGDWSSMDDSFRAFDLNTG